jgi:hypothetical protein
MNGSLWKIVEMLQQQKIEITTLWYYQVCDLAFYMSYCIEHILMKRIVPLKKNDFDLNNENLHKLPKNCYNSE